ncbi:DUF6879 family protein [Nonomuraea basaltis]|uniref:DUF6879 family protein n=1 Tax=Nonomuraea basaltis TaxID=2495887 RepID=UPI00110C6BE5|nr:DUF6879 family protein [Nonomuraea basaltis]TMR91304.1 hypothetical protein EJK15_50840 [Nonomuraea basaltis]
MESISPERRGELIRSTRHYLKLELRDNYQVDRDLLSAWRRDPSEVLAGPALAWRDRVVLDLSEGRSWRRLRVVSEPLSEYHKFAYEFAGPGVEAGEQMRYLPRRLTSAIPLPGNDCFVLDGRTVMFNVLDGDNQRVDIQLTTDPDVVKFCTDTFETAWTLAVPYAEYHP